MDDLIGETITKDVKILAEVGTRPTEPKPSATGANGITTDQISSWGWVAVLVIWGGKMLITKWLDWQSQTVQQNLELRKKESQATLSSRESQDSVVLQMVKDQNEAREQALQTYMQASLEANKQLLDANKQLVSELQHVNEAINAVTREMALQGYKQTELLRHVERLLAVSMHNHKGVVDIQSKMGMKPRVADWDEPTEIFSSEGERS